MLRSACFPAGGTEHVVEPLGDGDDRAAREIIAAREPGGAAPLLAEWLDRHPEQFAVARGPGGAVEALLHLAELDAVDAGLLAADPVACAWSAHLAAHPPRPSDRVLAMRRCIGRDSGEVLSPPVGACWLDVKRVYLELRPRLARLYSAMADFEALAPVVAPLGFAAVGPPVDLGGSAQQPVWLDFGDGSVDGWLARLVGAEIDAAEGAAEGERLAALSPRELEVLALIAEGLSNRQIAEHLVISEKTAGRHVSNLFGKLRVHNRAQAARLAAEAGLTR